MTTARIGDPTAHRRMLGRSAARRLDDRASQLPDAGPWRSIDSLGADVDGAFDTVVTVGALCAARDLAGAVATIRRVLAAGGRLLFLEHVGRPGGVGRFQRLVDPMWSSLPNGCHVDHDVPAALRTGGFIVGDLERCTMPSVVPFLRHWVQGVAR